MPEIFQPFYLATFAFFFFISLIIHFILRILFKRLNIVDKPDGIKKKHKKHVPISGGISLVVSLIVIILVYVLFSYSQILETLFEKERLKFTSLTVDIRTALLIGFTGLIVAAVSFFDDVLELPVWFRFMTLILCSGIVIGVSDLSLTSLGDLAGFGEIKLNAFFGTAFTIFCIVGVANAFNWIDGLDGLFSIQSLLAFFGLFFFIGGNGLFLILVLLAFLPYLLMNLGLLGHRNIVFIGDHGAMAVGYTIAWLLVSAAEFGSLNPITAPWIVGLVLLNSLRVMFKRFLQGASLFRSDREHIHHFFLDHGFSKTRSLLIITAISVLLTGTGILLETTNMPESLSFYFFIAAFLLWGFISLNLKKTFSHLKFNELRK